MRTAGAPLPAEFTRFSAGQTEVVCAGQLADALREIVARGTVYDYAARHPSARALVGRGTVYAVPLGDEHVVVRHNRHGGLLAPLTGDLFLAPTNAPRELGLSRQLVAHGVPTPVMLGYALYPVRLGFCRVDVVTREVPRSFDLSTALMSESITHRTTAIAAAANLVLALSAVGAHHADLNVKNVLLHPSTRTDGALDALVLDLDRVTFDEPEIVLERNLARLLRSARKWQRKHGAPVTQAELDELADSVRERRPPPVPESASS
jgi:lipopolysaccharide kinase (Kdo/WaaP) family protein